MPAAIPRKISRLPREERINDIVAAARAAFAEQGYESASMVEIAQRAGVAEGTIYKFFDGKRSLITAVLQEWYSGMIADADAKLAGVEGTRAQLGALIWHHLSVIRTDPDLCRLFYAEVRSREGYRDSALYTFNREVTQRLVSIVREGVDSGELREDLDVRLVRDIVFGGIEHHVAGFLAGRGDLDVDAVSEALTAFVMAGAARAPVPSGMSLDRAITRLERIADRMERP